MPSQPTASWNWRAGSSRRRGCWCARFDRGHSLKLVAAGVHFQVRETFESAPRFGEGALREPGVDADEAARIADEVRRLDAERFSLEMASGNVRSGAGLMLTNTTTPKPTPFITPRRDARLLNNAPEATPAEPSGAPDVGPTAG